ncbi:MAG: aminotransferase class I/II-fold pyridoxal phosphate-dependent enzyme, partial [Actinobacteria bacterium]|nr:aminotransferase class I/II-fold pyridoxal phosphate-dependent enzyme [Actinomycetota bacterium]
DGLAAAFERPEVTAYLLCSPHNPTGLTPSAGTLVAIAALALEHGVAVIADEIHAQLAHLGTIHTPFLTVASDGLTAVSLVSASKAWNIAGAKCAQVVAGSQPVMDILAERVPLEVTYATGHFGVLAAIAAYRDGGPWLEQVRTQITANALTVHERVVESMPAVRYSAPASSYLGWMDFSAYGMGDDPSGFFLEHARVALSAGPTFGQGGDGFVRLNFGTSPAILDEILARMSRSLAVCGSGA